MLCALGSSPRVRGTVRGFRYCIGLCRFIPACAGNRAWHYRHTPVSTVHPRVCGEQFVEHHVTRCSSGSSPRVRGTDRLHNSALPLSRFIPACAGNSCSAHRKTDWLSVHPRVCGEQLLGWRDSAATHGSSPRVRGTESLCPEQLPVFRFIPACAGNSRYDRVRSECSSVHPRVCGEQRTALSCRNRSCGSSPRVRGTVGTECVQNLVRRFIPACAGNRRLITTCGVFVAVHPRVCGEQPPSQLPPFFDHGSSPRVRGTVVEASTITRGQRFIPACAGNSSVYRRSFG